MDGEPELSVILVTETIPLAMETISHLAAQTAAGKLELVLGTPDGTLNGGPVPEMQRFHSMRVIQWDPAKGAPSGRAAAIFEASAPVVVLSETHCFPEPGWAEALIDAHRGPWAGVGPELDNDNPSGISWGNLLVDYSQWVAPATPGPADDIPGHNSSYKRSLLLEFGDELPHLLESESNLHWSLRARGHRLYVEPRARTHHRNITKVVPALVEHFYNGRTFGALRSRRWHPLRRILYALGSPLVPLLRASRIVRQLRQKDRLDLLRRALPMMMATLVSHAAGEMTGYLSGSGRSVPAMVKYEVDRDHFVAELEAPANGLQAAEATRER
jgi:hypothetical protein